MSITSGVIPTRDAVWLLVVTAVAFCLLTMVVVVAWLAVVPPSGKAVPSVIGGFIQSPELVGDAIRYLGAAFLLHIALAVVWAVVWAPFHLAKHGRKHVFLGFMPVLLCVVALNASAFPRSMFTPDMAQGYIDLVAVLTCAYVAIVVCASAWKSSLTRGAVLVVAIGIIGTAWNGFVQQPSDSERAAPDVIVIGIDSLRFDAIGPDTPNTLEFLKGATAIDSAWTPMARSYPAWISILTGRYPSSHGASFNLVARTSVDDSSSLPRLLGARGYDRVYATDETRFSNIDESFGFDRVIAPKIGAFDFIGSVAGDLPLVNLLAGTSAGKFLFPYIHMNRALHVSYDPRAFDRALSRNVRASDNRKPLFLAVHFELPHWPYTWRESGQTSHRAGYLSAVVEADRQFGALLGVLEAQGRLRNALVVLLSDHGEGFRDDDVGWVSDSQPIEPAWPGHGTAVFSEVQNRVVLAFRGYGPLHTAGGEPGSRKITASLVDVAPTIAEWLGREFAGDGESLLPYLSGRAIAPRRIVTIETGFTPRTLLTLDPIAIAEQTARFYDVEDGRLVLKSELLPLLFANKQRAAVSGDWILAALPPSNPGGESRLVLGNFRDLEHRDATDLDLQDSLFNAMLGVLCRRFGNDTGFQSERCGG